MTQGQVSASRIRWLMLCVAAVCWLGGALWIVNVAWPGWELLPSDPRTGAGLLGVIGFYCQELWAYWLVVAGYFGLFLGTQWLFLSPQGNWRVRLGQTGRPLRRSVVVAAFWAAVLSVGLCATVAEVARVWQKLAFREDSIEQPRYWPALVALAASWTIWAAVFFAYWRRGDRMTQLQRMLRGLLAGSILELLIAAPVHAWALRSADGEEECYCVRGSYTGLVLGGTVLLWTFGPGLVLLFLREKARRTPLLTDQDAESGAGES